MHPLQSSLYINIKDVLRYKYISPQISISSGVHSVNSRRFTIDTSRFNSSLAAQPFFFFHGNGGNMNNGFNLLSQIQSNSNIIGIYLQGINNAWNIYM